MKNNEVKPPERYAEPAERLTKQYVIHTKTRVRIFGSVYGPPTRGSNAYPPVSVQHEARRRSRES